MTPVHEIELVFYFILFIISFIFVKIIIITATVIKPEY